MEVHVYVFYLEGFRILLGLTPELIYIYVFMISKGDLKLICQISHMDVIKHVKIKSANQDKTELYTCISTQTLRSWSD
jgi:hypothetical protein